MLAISKIVDAHPEDCVWDVVYNEVRDSLFGGRNADYLIIAPLIEGELRRRGRRLYYDRVGDNRVCAADAPDVLPEGGSWW